MVRRWATLLWDLVKRTFHLWQQHGSAELASSLAFFGALALAGLTLIGTYVAALVLSHGSRWAQTRGRAGSVAGSQNAHLLDTVLRYAASRHDGWIALVIGALVFIIAVAASAIQLQRILGIVWDADSQHHGNHAAREAGRHVPQLAGIFALTLLLIVLLFAGAAVHGLTAHTHHLSLLSGLFYQSLVVGASIVVLTFVFLVIFAYLAPVRSPWRSVWIGALLSAVFYERGQFALSLYLGQMEARSPYADAGALLAVLVWLYYSAQVVLVGADFTRVLKERAEGNDKRKSRAAQRTKRA